MFFLFFWKPLEKSLGDWNIVLNGLLTLFQQHLIQLYSMHCVCEHPLERCPVMVSDGATVLGGRHCEVLSWNYESRTPRVFTSAFNFFCFSLLRKQQHWSWKWCKDDITDAGKGPAHIRFEGGLIKENRRIGLPHIGESGSVCIHKISSIERIYYAAYSPNDVQNQLNGRVTYSIYVSSTHITFFDKHLLVQV